MTEQQILEKAINKAINGGWGFDIENVTENPGGLMVMDKVGVKYTVNDIVFNKGFAKALWGEEMIELAKHLPNNYYPKGHGYQAAYLMHLQQLVIADDPIDYLGRNI